MRTNVNLQPQSERINVLPGIGDLQYWLHCTFYVTVKKFVLSKCENMEVHNAHYGTIDSLIQNTVRGVNYLNGSVVDTAKVLGLAVDNGNNRNYIEHRMEVIDIIMKIGTAPIREYKELSERTINVMWLYYIKGWQIEEIGSKFKIPYDEVRECFINFIYYFAHIHHGAMFLDIDSTHDN